ncbi:MAG: metal ABC transporter substrate-binding protein [Ruminococcus bromii]|nr:metal ABC transporter substrate-binding protein [Ruminococcus bromii]
MRNKLMSLLLVLLLVVITFSGCASTFNFNSGKLSIVTTIFPEYDWVSQIIGDSDNINVTMLIKNGVDLHSYQPSTEDIARISTCDMFVYVGGESDNWVDDVLKEAVNKNMIAINLLDVLGESAKEEEEVEGMQEERESHSENDEKEFDEHIWVSLKNAKLFTETITQKICDMDSKNKDIYVKNAEKYLEKLSNLDEQYQNTIQNSKRNTLLFVDRFPFRYLVDDYNLSYYAAFKGCSAETEASFDTITFLSNKINELNLNYVLKLENSDDRIAKIIIDTSKKKNVQIITIDSLQSVKTDDINNGTTYLSVMESNLEVLKKALS